MRRHEVVRLRLEERERGLAPAAARSFESRGRVRSEAASDMRTEYQRDRDRIIHCTAFRRLEYKTQVFVNHEGDLFRTRLTHSLEVAQIARSIARNLGLDEDLSEAIALAHDLGHTPFGHSGEKVMSELMAEHGGFEHNRQTLRILEVLEERYPKFPGLNLTYEVLEGQATRADKEASYAATGRAPRWRTPATIPRATTPIPARTPCEGRCCSFMARPTPPPAVIQPLPRIARSGPPPR